MLTRNTSRIIKNPLVVKLQTYPNPATNFVSGQLPLSIKNFTITVCNTAGQLVDMQLENSFSISDYETSMIKIIINHT